MIKLKSTHGPMLWLTRLTLRTYIFFILVEAEVKLTGLEKTVKFNQFYSAILGYKMFDSNQNNLRDAMDLFGALMLMFVSYKSFTWKMYTKFWHDQLSSYKENNVCIKKILDMETDFRDKMKIAEDLIHKHTPSPVTFYDKHKKLIYQFKEQYKENYITEREKNNWVGITRQCGS